MNEKNGDITNAINDTIKIVPSQPIITPASAKARPRCPVFLICLKAICPMIAAMKVKKSRESTNDATANLLSEAFCMVGDILSICIYKTLIEQSINNNRVWQKKLFGD